MHTPSHLSRPVTGHHSDDTGTIYMPPGLSLDRLAVPDPVPAAMDRKDQIFVELLRLRRYAVRLKWWQFSERRRINDEIAALKAEQDALHTLDSIVSQYKAEAGL